MIVWVLCCMLLVASEKITQDGTCYTADGRPVRCMPDFINIAFNAQVFSSNTCGDPPSEFCVQQEIGLPPQEDNCYICDKSSTENKHPPSHLTDNNEDDNPTWWQSQTLYQADINNMTLHLPFNKSFDIEYIKIEFQSPRPESMLIEKSTDYGRNWEVYQYFSSSCYKTFNKRTDEPIYVWDETVPVCTSRYSEISPLQGGVVNFSPLKGRPSAKDLYNTPVLLSWMRATDIRIRLMRLNTFGDQYFSDDKNPVMKTYFYAIRDLSVGGRCTCHGHGAYCTKSECQCEHFTAGRNCERCQDMYNDLPWSMATTDQPFQCKKCQCNGLANRCVFEEDVFIKSNNVSGGVCLGCRSNTAGQHCEDCAHGYYPQPNLPVGHTDRCQKCQCNIYGSVGDGACAQDLDVNRGLSFGDCQCKPHVKGIRCDTCQDGYHSLQEGCLRCDCDPVGTIGDYRLCDKATGQCKCKDNVTGQNCNKCIAGFYNYLIGCIKCNCDTAGSLSQSCDQETGQCQCRSGREGKDCKGLKEGTFKPTVDVISFGPAKPDGSKMAGGDTGDEDATSTTDPGDLIFDGLYDLDQENEIEFEVPRDDSYIILISYNYNGAEDANVRFDITADGSPEQFSKCVTKQVQAYQADVPPNYNGVYKIRDSCLDNDMVYTLRIALQDPLSRGNPFTVIDVKVIPTPSEAIIDQIQDDLNDIDVDNHAAVDFCLDKIASLETTDLEKEYPTCAELSEVIIADMFNGSVTCDCSSIGANEPDKCEPVGGQCSCKANVYGRKCDKCKPGYHSLSDKGCVACQCSEIGAESSACAQDTGECTCKAGVQGAQCTECEVGKFGYSSGKGCADCQCSAGSVSRQCDQYGQCPCNTGITGMRCDRCQDGYYDYSADGCKECECNSVGGSQICDHVTGQCRCKDNVKGDKCLQCHDNAFSLQQSNPDGCQLCFCHNHTDSCVGDTSFAPAKITSDFSESAEGWTYKVSDKIAAVEHLVMFQNIRIFNSDTKPLSFCLIAPSKFTGNRLSSFLTNLKFSYNIIGTKSRISEIVIRSLPYTLSQIPRAQPGDKYSTLLHHSGSWQVSQPGISSKTDKVSSLMLQSVLGDIMSLELCGTLFGDEGLVLSEFSMGSAKPKGGKRTAYNIEKCTCPVGYTGSSCEGCSAGYKRKDPQMGRLSECVPCECNGYSETCDENTGICVDCLHSTGGDMCQRCEEGYYGNPGYGNPSSCKPCACPSLSGSRAFSNTCELRDGNMVCTNCTVGHTGDRCEQCADGYFGEPSYDNPNQKCTQCTCNGNIDLSETDNCNTQTGQCLKCVGHTAGRECAECARGYFGDAINAKNCSKCDCNAAGSNNKYLCDSLSGQCSCKANVEGIACDRCKANYYDLESGAGCTACNCDLLGAADLQCTEDGACRCNPGYLGEKCNTCAAKQYYHPLLGCKACECNTEGSENEQCDERGQCPCKGAVQGRKCDTCPRNMVNLAEGCVNCPDCYSLVEKEVDNLREKLDDLKEIMEGIDTPTIAASPDFRKKIDEVQSTVRDTFSRANETAILATQLEGARQEIEKLIDTLQSEIKSTESIAGNVAYTVQDSANKIQEAQDTVLTVRRELEQSAKLLLDNGERALKQAQDNMNNLSKESMDMQKKATLARKIAQEQEKTSQETVKLAEEAQQLAASALNTAKKARDTLRNTQEQLDKLTTDIGELKEEYELAKNAATASVQSAEQTLKTAKQLHGDACTQSPLSLDALEKELGVLGSETRAAVRNTEQMRLRVATITASATITVEQTEELLARGATSNSDLDKLRTKAQAAFDESATAVAECSELIKEAQKLLTFLQNYEKEVAKAKSDAKSAIKQLEGLEKDLESAEDNVEGAVVKLGDGKKDMGMVLQTIRDAKHSLDQSLISAKSTSTRISEMLETSGDVRDDAATIKRDVKAAASEIRRLRAAARNGTEFLKDILKNAEDSKALADSVGSEVEFGGRKLKSLKKDLDEIATVDSMKLSQLIGELTKSSETIKESGIDDKIKEMRLISEQQDNKIAEYRAKIQQMRDEINSLEKIEAQIPDTSTCYNPNQ